MTLKKKKVIFYKKDELNLQENFFKKGKGKQLVYTNANGQSFTYGRHKVNYFLKAKFGEPCCVDEYTCTQKKQHGCSAKIFEKVKDSKELGLFCFEGRHYCHDTPQPKESQIEEMKVEDDMALNQDFNYSIDINSFINQNYGNSNTQTTQRICSNPRKRIKLEEIQENDDESFNNFLHIKRMPPNDLTFAINNKFNIRQPFNFSNGYLIQEQMDQNAILGIEITGVYPERGKTLGGDYIEVYFSLRLREGIGYDQLIQYFKEENLETSFYIQFDVNVCQKIFIKKNVGNPQLEKINPSKYNKCKGAQFKILLYTPAHKEGKVDVHLQFLPTSVYQVLKGGFEYFDHTKDEFEKTNKQDLQKIEFDEEEFDENLFSDESFFNKPMDDFEILLENEKDFETV